MTNIFKSSVRILYHTTKYAKFCSSSTSKDLSGIFPPMPTPFAKNTNEDIAWNELQHNLMKWNDIKVKG